MTKSPRIKTSLSTTNRLSDVEREVALLGEGQLRTQEDVKTLTRGVADLGHEMRQGFDKINTHLATPEDSSRITSWLAIAVAIFLAVVGAVFLPWTGTINKHDRDIDTLVALSVQYTERMAKAETNLDWVRLSAMQDGREVSDRLDKLEAQVLKLSEKD